MIRTCTVCGETFTVINSKSQRLCTVHRREYHRKKQGIFRKQTIARERAVADQMDKVERLISASEFVELMQKYSG
jgi:hypothetical protein